MTIDIVRFLNRTSGGDTAEGEEADYAYPTLHELTYHVATFPMIVQKINQLLDKYGKMRDNASPHLLAIRQELSRTEGSVSRALNSILRAAQSEGLVDKDAAPTMRDGGWCSLSLQR